MATGDQQDFVARLKAVLPAGWFPADSAITQGQAPVLDAVLAGPAYGLAWIYALTAYAKDQTRIATATDVWLDMAALDYFGVGGLPRRTNEADPAYSARIRASLLTPKNTRAAVIAAVEALTGIAPAVFEPANSGDTGGYSAGTAWEGLAYNTAGGYGSLALPFQFFITASLPVEAGAPNVAGYYTGSGWSGGGYGVGAIEYVTISGAAGQVTEAMIYATIAGTIPAGTIAWTAISP